ncbi:MAG: InlB B-repeat-containing protein [Clostridia bacterium]|nr:InlB B-repeat-containing protein [Clostridia bacterium]
MKKQISVMMVILLILCVISAVFVGCYQDIPADTAPKEYVIQYADDSGMHQITVTDGMPYSLEVLPTKAGYKFMGLFDAQVGGTQYVADNGLSLAPFTDGKNMVLFPQFKANDYTVVLEYLDSNEVGERQFTVAYGASLPQLPKNLTGEHKTFSGWYTAPNCQGTKVADKHGLIPVVSVLNSENFDLSRDLVYLYAGFEVEKYTVTCYFEAGIEPEEFQVEYNTPISKIVPETRVDGKAPLTWSKTQGGEVFNGKITDDTVLYALEYAPVIDFDVNGGEKINPIVTRAGDAVQLPTPIRSNYKFVGWETAGGTAFDSTTMPVDSIKLTAKWQAMIVFETNGGTDVTDISQPQGTKITLPNTEKASYMFAGWYDESGQKYIDSAMPSVSVKLYAKYWKIEKIIKVLIDETSSYYVYDRTSPSVDSYCKELDLGEIFNNGVREIVVTAHYQAKASYGTTSKPQYMYVTWYSVKTASDAYKLWQIEDKHIDSNWATYTEKTKISLSSSKVYLSFWAVGFNIYNSHDKPYWKDYYLEIEYPNMSKLY